MKTEEQNKSGATGWGCLVLLALLIAYAALTGHQDQGLPSSTATSDPSSFRIIAESAIKPLEDEGILANFSKESGIQLSVSYRGPVDIYNAVSKLGKNKPTPVDAYWPGSSIWLPGSYTVEPESMMKTFVVLAVEPDAAKNLGWDTARGISASDVIAAARSGKLKLAMTSATQSTPGAAFFLAMYTALTGQRVLMPEHLQDAELTEQVEGMLKGIEQSAADLGHLEDVFVQDKTSGNDRTNAIVAYESIAIDLNKHLIAAGQTPLTVFYIQGATAIADFPIRYVDNGDKKKLDQYQKLVEYLIRPEIQEKIRSLGWRTCPIGMTCGEFDPAVFNPKWGIDTKTEFPEMIFPKPPVAQAALRWYQARGRKASFTIYCLDYSGSMEAGMGRIGMVQAMDLLLDQGRASEVQLQATSDDVTVVYGFSSDMRQIGDRVQGDDPMKLKELSNQIGKFRLGSGTAMFSCVEAALRNVGTSPDTRYNYAVIALTDGQSNEGATSSDFEAFYKNGHYEVPVYGIAFGAAEFAQLETFKMTGGDVYDGRQDVAAAFRMAKGNN